MPRVEASRHVDHIAIAGALEQTAANHAAISALAVNGNRTLSIDCGQSVRKRIERPTLHLRDVPSLPFAFAAHIEDFDRAQASVAQFLVQFLSGNLRRLQHWLASLLPSRQAASQITTQIFDADTSQPQLSFLDLRLRV